MFCFENALFESCKPILVVYFVFVFCVILISIVLLRCVCSSDENELKEEFLSTTHGYNFQDKNHFPKLKGNESIEDKKMGRDKKIALDIELQQMEIYQMAEYNQIRPSYI